MKHVGEFQIVHDILSTADDKIVLNGWSGVVVEMVSQRIEAGDGVDTVVDQLEGTLIYFPGISAKQFKESRT